MKLSAKKESNTKGNFGLERKGNSIISHTIVSAIVSYMFQNEMNIEVFIELLLENY